MATAIPGYTYGTAEVPRAPFSLSDLELLKKVHRHLKERFSRHLMLVRSRG